MTKAYNQECPVAQTLDIIGDRWTLLIVRDLLQGRHRFQDLLKAQEGLAPNVLSERLKRLEEHGIVSREFYNDHPPRAEYHLTRKGSELGLVLGALATWGNRYMTEATQVIHDECGAPLRLRYYCPHCNTIVPGAQVHLAKPTTAEPVAEEAGV